MLNSCREPPPISAIEAFIDKVQEKIHQRRDSAQKQLLEGRQVTSFAYTEQLKSANLAKNNEWEASYVEGNEIKKIFDVYKYKNNFRTSMRVVLIADSSLPWWSRIDCSCQGFYQYPGGCMHIAYVLQYFIYANPKLVGIAQGNSLLWKPYNKLWYAGKL